MKVRVNVKPLSVNECWKGRRYKTDKYKAYEKLLLLTLPKQKLPAPPYKITFEFGMSNILSDWDNPIKGLQDIMQKKYGFNDRDVMEAYVKKVKVNKDDDYFEFTLTSL